MPTATDKRVFHKAFPIKDITFDPTDNYRWGSVASMERDLQALDVESEDGKASSFEVLKKSIENGGVEEPIGLRVIGAKIRVIYGFTRYVACSQLGHETVPAFLYEDLTDSEAASLQLRENSVNLKRAVGWVATTRMFNHLVDATVEECMSIPVAERSTDSRGHCKSARRMAIEKICSRMGVSERTMGEQSRVLKVSHPRAVALADEGRLSVWCLKELQSGDKDNPYSDDFIEAVLTDVLRTTKNREITSVEVRNAVKRIKAKSRHEINSTSRGSSDKAPAAIQNDLVDTRRVSGGCLRDLATNVAMSYVAKHNLGSPEATDEAWAKVTMSSAWCIVQGIAMSSGESPLPEGADSENGAEITQALRLARGYVRNIFLRAIVRQEVTRRFKVSNYTNWLSSSTDKCRTRRFEVSKAIQTVLDEAKDTDTLKAMFMRVFDELRDSAAIPATR